MAEAAVPPASAADASQRVEQQQEHALSNGNATADAETTRAGPWGSDVSQWNIF